MSQQKTREMTRQREVDGPDSDPFEENTGGLQQQAEAYARIAREARENCDQDAERELQRRRNRSGQ